MTRDDIIDIIKDTQYCILGTVEGNHPRVRPMSPYLTENGELFVALLPNIRTIKQIKENPLVELCYVDRHMNFARISGKAQMIDAKDKKQLLWDNVPSLKQYYSGPEDPNFLLMNVEILHAEAMSPADIDPVVVEF